MNMKSVLLSVIVLAAFVVISCSRDDNHPSMLAPDGPSADRKWTVLFYGAGNDPSDQLEDGSSRVLTAVRGLEQSRFDEQISVLACISTLGHSGGLTVYEVGFHPSSEAEIASLQVARWESVTSNDAEQLRRFVEVGMSVYPAQNYILLLNGSGDGVGGTCRDNTAGDAMTVSEMRIALSSVTVDDRPAHFAIIAWLAPEMGSIEVAYELNSVADYMAAIAWKQPFNFVHGLRQWMFDFASAPEADAQVIGSYLVDAVYESALESNQDYRYTLWDLSLVDTLAAVVEEFGVSLSATVVNAPNRILAAHDSAWNAVTDDSNAVDVAEFAHQVADDSSIINSVNSQLAETIDQLVQQMIVYSRTTNPEDTRVGLSVYLPGAESGCDLGSYGELQFAHDMPGWLGFITELCEVGNNRTTIQGTTYWPGHALDSRFRFFINRSRDGAEIPFAIPIEFTHYFRPDSASFTVSFNLETEVDSCYLGVFRDIDGSGALSSGDSLGFYKRMTSVRDWVAIERGEAYDSIAVTVRYRQQ